MTIRLNLIRQAMQAAAVRGYDPLNSHPVQAEMLQRHWRLNEGRVAYREAEQKRHRSEALANQELAQQALIYGTLWNEGW